MSFKGMLSPIDHNKTEHLTCGRAMYGHIRGVTVTLFANRDASVSTSVYTTPSEAASYAEAVLGLLMRDDIKPYHRNLMLESVVELLKSPTFRCRNRKLNIVRNTIVGVMSWDVATKQLIVNMVDEEEPIVATANDNISLAPQMEFRTLAERGLLATVDLIVRRATPNTLRQQMLSDNFPEAKQ